MTFLDFDRLAAIDAAEFHQAKPYPWLNPYGLLTEEGYRRLLATCPEVTRFDPAFGVARKHGQQSHDRFVLEYRDGLDIGPDWQQFIGELSGPRYLDFLRRMTGRHGLSLTFHWHYTPNGCSVSPHCDAEHKIGSHIFYLNTEDEWREEWGGQTVVLDDGGRFPRRSAPRFEDFDRAIDSKTLGNYSFLFARCGNSWHGVREIRCPQDRYRKVFIVVINHRWKALRKRVVDRLTGRKSKDY
ncbi:MAG TPA: 2OG-Fe(II) oxygenase [Terriglobales bacterium]|nr:2OG-Fe(II) oxygenase [Terriglobales bacterium]